ncbi:hypothetical protein V5O48_008866 [Marasmius crinis-equi]|uniref:chitin deacetylase n=1 Tax=Marasmius crinis-equi TaxID=585013 RepID=A0ABR3FCR2_9AGAR
MFQSTFLCLALAVFSAQSVVGHDHRSHRRFFRDGWAQPQNHSVNTLFKRQTDGAQYPAVGSSEWSAKYPKTGATPDKGSTPKEWLETLSAAIAAGKIPDIAPSTMGPTGNPTYGDGKDPTSPQICSSTYECRAGGVWDGPDGTFGISFDDGPLAPTTGLVNFLKENKETATHFMIGGNILANFKQFQEIVDYGGDCAVHTWSHQYMTTLSNEDVVAELGWTMQIIHDSTGGKVPRIWRPPYGDSDVRVRAIAKEVFGMDTVIWNHDTDDWGMTAGKNTMDNLLKDMNTWLAGPKSPGLIVLEHESTDDTVKAFTTSLSNIKSNGWQTKSLALLLGDVYQNVNGNTVLPAQVDDGPKSNSSSNSATSQSADPTGSGSKPTSTTSSGTGSGTAAGAASTGNSASASRTTSLFWPAVAVLGSTLLVVS